MLDYAKLMTELETRAADIFAHNPDSYSLLFDTWQRIIQDAGFLQRARAIVCPWPIPSWLGEPASVHPVAPYDQSYVGLSVDGSQIYPDRHTGLSCYMINIGTVTIPYLVGQVRLHMESEPFIFSGSARFGNGSCSGVELVNAQRLEYELHQGYKQAAYIKSTLPAHVPLLVLFDGSLIFWHLDSQEKQEEWLPIYNAILGCMYAQQIMCAWYISMPKSKDLMHLIKLALCNFDYTRNDLYAMVEQYVDASIMYSHLPVHHHSALCNYTGFLHQAYSDACKPYFMYMHVGDEIARIEFPAWVAQDRAQVNLVARLVLDQCIKGQGYPVILAEAHEQAVVTGQERDFFYKMIDSIGLRYNQRPTQSRKSFKKKYKVY